MVVRASPGRLNSGSHFPRFSRFCTSDTAMVDFWRGRPTFFKTKHLLDPLTDFDDRYGKIKLLYLLSLEKIRRRLKRTFLPPKMVGNFYKHFLSKILPHLRFTSEISHLHCYQNHKLRVLKSQTKGSRIMKG